ncbi:MAG TPA: histidine kinase [Chitinophagaceae bacterium]|nr:histidine kinase [Chitinophagaceae bacterium]
MYTRILYTVLLVLAASLAGAQVPGMRKYTLLDGFTANNSYYIDQDKRGYVWIGTDNGGMRFDGRQFAELQQFYRPDNKVILRCALVDSAVMLLFPFAGRMQGMNPATLTPVRIQPEVFARDFWRRVGPSDTFLSISQNAKTAYRFYGKKITEYKLDAFADTVMTFAAIGNRFIGWGAHNYLYAYDPQNHTRQRLFRDHKIPMQHLNGERSIHLEGSNSIIIYNEKCNSAAIYEYRPGDSLLQCLRSLKLPKGVTDVSIALLDRNNHLWMVFNNNIGVGYYDFARPEKTGEMTYVLPARYVHNVFIDDHDNIWLSTSNNSLYFLSEQHFKNAALSRRFPMQTELPKSISGNEQELCISYVNKNILACINGNKTRLITLSSSFANGFRLLEFDPGRYIIWGSKLGLVNTRTGHASYMGPVDISYKDVCSYDHNGVLAATSYQVAHINIGKPGWKNIFTGRSSAVCVLLNRHILIGTPYGLFASPKLYDSVLKVKDSVLQRTYILSILALEDSSALVGTDGEGLFLYRSKGSVKKIDWPEKNRPDQIQKIYKQRDKDAYWLATNKGVYVLTFNRNWDIQQLKSYTFYDGLPSNDVRDVYVYKDTAYVTTAEGLGIIPFADSAYAAMPAPDVYINTVQTGKRAFTNVHSLPGLPYNENDLRLSVSAISYESIGNIQYYYRIYPLQEKWTQTANPDIQLNRLPPGTHTFEVYAVNAKGVKSIQPARLDIKIHPAFWQTWWFISLVLAFIIIVVALAVYYRIRSVREQEQLRNDLQVFRDQALRGQMNPHFIYNSLNTIQNYILKSEKMASAFFLSKFSQLMRITFDNTSQERITLDKDLEALVLYVELENMRFGNKITLHIRKNTEVARLLVPPLILQPFVENAILHGFLSAQKVGNIYMEFVQKEGALQVSITDDGIGREQAAAIKLRRQKYQAGPVSANKKSGIITTRERIEQAWGKRAGKADFKILDLQDGNGQPCGTTVLFNLPLTND